MKKLRNLLFIGLVYTLINSCSGYEPIFSSKNLQFQINDYEINGDQIIGNKIFSKLNSLSKSDPSVKSVSLKINSTKTKNPTVKNSAGKILEYKIIVNSEIIINDFITGEKILDQNFDSSLNYKVQNQYSDTLNLENRSIENLVNNIYQKILLVLSQKI